MCVSLKSIDRAYRLAARCVCVRVFPVQALDVDPATGLLEGDEDEEGFEEEYPLEQLNIATADFMAKVTNELAPPLAATVVVFAGCFGGCLSGHGLSFFFSVARVDVCFVASFLVPRCVFFAACFEVFCYASCLLPPPTAVV